MISRMMTWQTGGRSCRPEKKKLCPREMEGEKLTRGKLCPTEGGGEGKVAPMEKDVKSGRVQKQESWNGQDRG